MKEIISQQGPSLAAGIGSFYLMYMFALGASVLLGGCALAAPSLRAAHARQLSSRTPLHME